jgi:hypothetical protein
MARSSRFKDFDAATQQREPIEFVVAGRTYLLPGDPPVSIVARIIGASAEGGLNVEIAQAQLDLAKAELAIAVLNEAGGTASEERTKAEAEVESRRGTLNELTSEMNRLFVDLLGKANADQMIADGVGYYTYNRVLRWVPVAYGLRNEEEPDPAGAARAVVAQLRDLPSTKQRPELLALLDQFDAVIEEEAGRTDDPKERTGRKEPQDHKQKTTRRPVSASGTSSRGG